MSHWKRESRSVCDCSMAAKSTVYFAEYYGLPRNLLGKFGWLQQIRFGLVDYDEMIYLSDYNDPV